MKTPFSQCDSTSDRIVRPRPRAMVIDVIAGRDLTSAMALCPGGMMSMAVTDVMESSGASWPEAHSDSVAMATLSAAMYAATGFDNLAFPFCMTVEAESFGASADLGGLCVQPRVTKPVLAPDGSGSLSKPDFTHGRARVVLDAIALARNRRPDAAIIGGITGPFSLLGTLCDPLGVFRWTRRRKGVLHSYLDKLTEGLTTYALTQVKAGADVICIAEPTATGEILGGPLFGEFVRPRIESITTTLHAAGAHVIVHICGDTAAIEQELFALPADAVSFDSVADIVAIARRRPPWRVMGNIDPFFLNSASIGAVKSACVRLCENGVRLIAPGCGVIPTTPVENLRAMRSALS